jgi:NADPH-dependent glutamate synthase beta subunit-like oxidoreductase
MGAAPTVLEAQPVAGGMLAVGIPSYRLPRRILEAEIDFIRGQGVEIRTGVRVGRDITLEGLLSEGYRAVLAAPGTHREARLRIPGEDRDGVVPGLAFLGSVNLNRLSFLEGNVVVVGGGNVAMDAARAALRLGAAAVTVVYRRSRLEMPANDWEVREAEEEGIRFHFLANPVRILGSSRVEGIECLQMELGEPDASGRRRPVPVEGSEFVISCGHVIPAIGLSPETSFLEGTGVRLESGGAILTRSAKVLATHRKGLFAAGDAVTGPSSVIAACAQGRRAAMAIVNHLGIRPGLRFATFRTGAVQSEFASRPRVPQKSRPAETRISDFRLIHQVYDSDSCRSEGRRCLRCDRGV